MGVLTKNEDGTIDMLRGIKEYINYLRENSFESQRGSMTLAEAKNRRVIAQAQLLEMEVELRKGELVQVVDVQPQWERFVQACKNKLLAIPSKAAPVLVGQQNIAYVNDVLADHITEALNELVKSDIEIVEEEYEEDIEEEEFNVSENNPGDG